MVFLKFRESFPTSLNPNKVSKNVHMQGLCDQMTYGTALATNWNIPHNADALFRTMTDNSRKRSREDDSCEFMPLSKRINNLHINNAQNSAQNSNLQQEASHLNGITENSLSSSSESEQRPSYDPGLTSQQSRYYFDNKLLFELHLERIQRTGQQFPF